MTEPSDNYDPTDADLDLVLEDTTGKPVKPADLATGIASMQKNFTASLSQSLIALNQRLSAARQRLHDYETQLRAQN
jgi:hypothetical protein